jgi:catechol 2,3-dioxygenase-like lactoylglutathione lyase family enzyme
MNRRATPRLSGGLLIVPGSGAAQEHVAFRVAPATFNGVLNRLRAKGVEFGNDHEDSANRQTINSIGGGHGRVYFLDPNGHLFEVLA